MRHMLLLILATLASAADPPCLGIWQNVADAGDQMAFEADRCINLDKGALQHFFARYPDAGTVRLGWLGEARLHVTVQGDRLELRQEGTPPTTYKRLPAMPDSLRIAPFPIPAAKPIAAAALAALQQECRTRRARDQAGRGVGGMTADQAAHDRDNTDWLKRQCATYGWLDAARCGKDAAVTAFLIVQHSGDMPLMLAALPCIEADVVAGTGDPQDYAMLFDRTQLNLGRRQRFGSQIGQAGGRPAVFPIEDRTGVEARRAKIRLFPLAQYLAMYAKMSGQAAIFMDDLPLAP